MPGLGVLIAEIDAAAEGAGLASGAKIVDLVGAALRGRVGEKLLQRVGVGVFWMLDGRRSKVRMNVREMNDFRGGDVEAMAIGFEFAAAAGGLADGAARGDVGVGGGEDGGDGFGEGWR